MFKNLAMSNSDASLPPPPTSITLDDGSTVAVDDFVYLQTDYPDEPYVVGRIMEFAYVSRNRYQKLSLSKAHNNVSAGEQSGTSTPAIVEADAQLRARLAWFPRGRDLPVSRMRAKDARFLVATMHADLNPVSAIKGRCHVRHLSEIHDLNAWKSKPDHFYYQQLFDRNSTRLYDIIPVTQIRNAPQNVLQKLLDTYEFIFAENQKISDLVNTRRACTICAKWCSINESLKCSLCDKNYHMQCLDPPLTRKPAKGYSWQCAACLRSIQEQKQRSGTGTGRDRGEKSLEGLDDFTSYRSDRKRNTRHGGTEEFTKSLRSGNTGASGGSTVGSAAASDTESRSGGNKRLRTSHYGQSVGGGGGSASSTRGGNSDSIATPIPRPKNRGLWPFRYFGLNTNIDDVLHDDERIFPLAVSRLGPKYQAIVPDMVSPSGPELDKSLRAQLKTHNEKEQEEERKKQEQADKGKGKAKAIGRPKGSKTGSRHGQGTAAGRETGGGGAGGSRWHAKNAEQLNKDWDEIEMQRGNHDEELFFRQPTDLLDEELDMYTRSIMPFLQRHFADILDFTLLDCQDAALNGLVTHGYDVEEALISIPDCPEAYIRHRAQGDNWTRETVDKFNESLSEYGSNLISVRKTIPEMTYRAVALRYYLERPTGLGKRLLGMFDSKKMAGGGLRRPNLGQAGEGAGNVHLEVASDAGISSVNTPASSPHLPSSGYGGNSPAMKCLHCQIEESRRWFRAPNEVTSYNTRSAKASNSRRVMCEDCCDYWLRYGTMPDQDAIATQRKSRPSISSPAYVNYAGGIHHHSTRNYEQHKQHRQQQQQPLPLPKTLPQPPPLPQPVPPPVSQPQRQQQQQQRQLQPQQQLITVHSDENSDDDGPPLSATISATQKRNIGIPMLKAQSDEQQQQGSGLHSQIMFLTKAKNTALKNWDYHPCAICHGVTNNTHNDMSASPVLVCQECGLCAHQDCAGYPEEAQINLRRWKCNMCTNVSSPTVSLNYTCVLCRREEEPKTGTFMWRTAGNNWVHPICALFQPETQLSYDHGYVAVEGLQNVSAGAWCRKCTLCNGFDGSCVKCAVDGCATGMHISCVLDCTMPNMPPYYFATDQGKPLLRAVANSLGERVEVKQSVSQFISQGKKLAAVAKCGRHAHLVNDTVDIGFSEFDRGRKRSIIAAMVTSKRAPEKPLPDALLRQALTQSPSKSKGKQPLSAALPTRLPQIKVVPKAAASIPSTSPLVPNGVSWSTPSQDPICKNCSTQFSPIWWPASPSGDSSHINVLCLKCYTTGTPAAAAVAVSERANTAA